LANNIHIGTALVPAPKNHFTTALGRRARAAHANANHSHLRFMQESCQLFSGNKKPLENQGVMVINQEASVALS